jgi:hypothetical protein
MCLLLVDSSYAPFCLRYLNVLSLLPGLAASLLLGGRAWLIQAYLFCNAGDHGFINCLQVIAEGTNQGIITNPADTPGQTLRILEDAASAS